MKVDAMADGLGWTAYNGDCVEVVSELPTASVDFSCYSPPFASLFVYSPSERDFGNCRSDDEFFRHYDFLIAEMARVMKPGRLIAIHAMDLPTSKERHGYIGLRDFPAAIRAAHEKRGFIYHSRVCIWKCPVTAVTRTKSLGLLHKQLKKDSAMSRQGLPDYLIVMRTPGQNPDPVTHTNESFPVERWQRYASPVWATMGETDEDGFLKCSAEEIDGDESSGINPSNTLQGRSAREHEDERHICPLQLSVIRRAVRLWSNPGDVVLSPFMGIGSEGYVALQEGRRFIGAELKCSYFAQAAKNLAAACVAKQIDLLEGVL